MIERAIQDIRRATDLEPEIGLILGSGLGDFAENLEDKVYVPYEDISGFSSSTVAGHKGRLVFGTLEGKRIVAMQGRVHYYEGIGIDAVVFPVRVMAALGVKRILVTNAAGGVNRDFQPGTLMIIRDHINYAGVNPLVGPNIEGCPRFPDMTEAYHKAWADRALSLGEELGISMEEGVYMWFSGPNYETPAEVRMARILGADAVGMSTVPEVLVARHLGIEILGISCITNMAAGILDQPLVHDEVMEISRKVASDFKSLLTAILRES